MCPTLKPPIQQVLAEHACFGYNPDMNTQAAYQPATLLRHMLDTADPPYRFRSTDREEATNWQESTRAALSATLGIDSIQSGFATDPSAETLESVDRGDYRREKLRIATTTHSSMPVYLLVPKNAEPPLPVVIAFHGHGYGVKDIVGLWEDGTNRDTPDGYHRDFAVELCRRGFAVAAPEISCFGERQNDFSYLDTTMGQGVPTTCTHSAMLAFHLGISVAGLRVHDGIRLLDYLETRDDLYTGRVGAMGISGGGMHTFFSSCIDTRISACVISGYFSEFKSSILAMSHCACNFVPGLWQFGEMSDLIGMIAPRPVCIEAGSRDPIFPIDAVKRGVEQARSVYRVFGAEDRVRTDFFEGRHRINGEAAYTFLHKELTP